MFRAVSRLRSQWSSTEINEILPGRIERHCKPNFLEIVSNSSAKADLHELGGRVLGCWCHPLGCHGHVLTQLYDSFDSMSIGEIIYNFAQKSWNFSEFLILFPKPLKNTDFGPGSFWACFGGWFRLFRFRIIPRIQNSRFKAQTSE